MTAVTADWRVTLTNLVREHQAGVWRYLRFLGCNPIEAEDLVQETFLAVLREGFEVRSTAATAAYLRSVARNRFLMARRRNRAAPMTINLDAADAVWMRTAREDGLEAYLIALRECLQNTVTPRTRQALELQYSNGSSRNEIAAALDLSVEGVKTLLRRARTSLRECVERKLAQ